jgi:hypothetical protein
MAPLYYFVRFVFLYVSLPYGSSKKMLDCDEGALRAPSSQSNMSFKNFDQLKTYTRCKSALTASTI